MTQLCDLNETSGMEKISKILVDILEILMTNGPSKSIVEDFDIFKLLFLTYPLMQESTERVILSMLFQYQNELDFILRIFQDLITIVELRDSIEYFPDLKKKHKASLQRKNNNHTVDPTEDSKAQEERENRVHRKKPVYFEEMVEFSVGDTIKMNVDNLKIKAMDFLEKVLRIFELVAACHQNFQEYYVEAGKQPPFDPYLMLISAWESTNVREVQDHIRATFKKIGPIEFFSKQSFSFQTDLNELSSLCLSSARERVPDAGRQQSDELRGRPRRGQRPVQPVRLRRQRPERSSQNREHSPLQNRGKKPPGQGHVRG